MEKQGGQNSWTDKAIEYIEAYFQKSGKKALTIVIDGMSGAGKTTLGELLHEKYGGNLFHTDDFFLQPYQRIGNRLTEPGGNVDYERLKTEIIDQLRNVRGLQYGIYDCHIQGITKQITVPYEAINIVEGSYSTHPYLGAYADICFFLETNTTTQRQRIEARNGQEMLERFIREWIPKENQYFDIMQIREKCVCLRTDMEPQKGKI